MGRGTASAVPPLDALGLERNPRNSGKMEKNRGDEPAPAVNGETWAAEERAETFHGENRRRGLKSIERGFDETPFGEELSPERNCV
jgi:hypothetical protein